MLRIFFHVSFEHGSLSKLFVPRIPKSHDDEEDRSTPRICVCPTVHQCLIARADELRDRARDNDGEFVFNVPITVYYVGIENGRYIPPDILYNKHNVFDAGFTDEHWITEPVTMQGKHAVLESYELPTIESAYCRDIPEIKDSILKSLSEDAVYLSRLAEVRTAFSIIPDYLFCVDAYEVLGSIYPGRPGWVAEDIARDAITEKSGSSYTAEGVNIKYL
jgi:hypothetical protein